MRKRSFRFVAGSWHGAWCWFKVLPRLRALGHDADALELPGHGPLPRRGTFTLDDYVDAVREGLGQAPEPVVLVGHSRAGIVISQAAEAIPEKVERLVYVAAYLIPDGETMADTANTDVDSRLYGNLVFDPAEGTHAPRPEAVRDALYGDCGDDDVALASALLTPEPNRPVSTPLRLGPGFARVPRVYVECTRDRCVSPGLQRTMQRRVGVTRTVTLDTAHSPFLSAPATLAAILTGC